MSVNRLLLKPLLLGTCVIGPSGQALEYVLNASPWLVAWDPTVPPRPSPMAEAPAPSPPTCQLVSQHIYRGISEPPSCVVPKF